MSAVNDRTDGRWVVALAAAFRRFAALVAAASAYAALIGGTAQADQPPNQGGPPGEAGSATIYCWTSEPPQGDADQVVCTATPGKPGAPGPAVAYD